MSTQNSIFRNKGKIKSFSDKLKLRDSLNRPTLKKLLSVSLKGNDTK